MSTSTRIFLAVTALLLVVLVLYYGVFSDAPKREVSTAAAPEATEPQEPVREERLAAREEPRRTIEPPAAPESLREPEEEAPSVAMGPAGDANDDDEDEPEVAALGILEDLEPVILGAPGIDHGGKDAPPPASPEADDSNEAPDAAPEPDDEGDAQPEPDPEPAPAPQPPAAPQYTEYTVRANDTMSSIAQDWFGDGSKWDLIAKANPLVDPARLQVGQVLRLPPKDAQREEGGERAGGEPVTYTVRSGDTLSRIAQSYYGAERHWRLIYEANKPTIGLDPNNLKVGMKLTIPPAPKPAADE